MKAENRSPKLLGADVELGNFVLGIERPLGTGAIASRALLHQIEGLPGPSPEPAGKYGSNPQDWGRKYLPSNGGCLYIDLDHLELCTPEVLNAYDFAAAFHAMLRIARAALLAANSKLADGMKIVVLVNNEDGKGHSYGSHMSWQITRSAWDRLFLRRLQDLLTLASFQVSSIPLTGQGKVSSELGTGIGVGFYEISQRASFFQCLVGPQTTFHRPLVNSRDEALCGGSTTDGSPADRFARLHCIFFDSTLCPASIVLRAGLMQIVLAILESGQLDNDLELMLADPVETAALWSRDLTLTARATVLTGQEVTALDLQRRFFDKATRFAGAGGCDGIVPRAQDILNLWADTLDKLSRRDFSSLAGRLDWVLKWQLLERTMRQRRDLDWNSPEIKHLDFRYGDLEEGLFWACDQAGAVERLGVTDEKIGTFLTQPPTDTRAWTRAHLLRLADPWSVAEVDWDRITFKLRSPSGAQIRRTVSLANPLGFTKNSVQALFNRSDDLAEVLDLLGAPERDPPLGPASTQYWLPSYGSFKPNPAAM